MQIIRTFHPVGQGAFYSEEITCDKGERYCIVYDCGSVSANIEDYIGKNFSGKEIDILFISHLHADHINGINALKHHCRIKSVVMPLIKEQDKIMLKIANLQNVNRRQAGDLDFDTLIDDPVRFFNDTNDTRGERTRIIRIANAPHVDPENDRRRDKEPKKYKDRSLDTILKDHIHETSRLYPDQKLTLANGKWIYILINHREDERIKQFKEALPNKLVLPKRITIDFYEQHKDTLTEAYNHVDGDLNSNSLIVYSGYSGKQPSCVGGKSSFSRPTSIVNCALSHNREGCLYTGDANLKNRGLIDQIESSLSCCKEKIHIIQVPHHGSEHNWNNRIMYLNPKCDDYVISHGCMYGHPAPKVKTFIESVGKKVHEVTHTSAKYEQLITIK